ncbi:MAG TPA: MBL fold metallo-hydrolase, partial [Gammaproteobacteria bacterium]|nr:MBL fold metallo-hydrolase [Gammaproteobacteria bacterium]
MRNSELSTLLKAGEPVPVSELVTRVLARNPGMMTGPGTNSYLVGHREVAVIDPGPVDETHIEAILQATKGRIRWVLVT